MTGSASRAVDPEGVLRQQTPWPSLQECTERKGAMIKKESGRRVRLRADSRACGKDRRYLFLLSFLFCSLQGRENNRPLQLELDSTLLKSSPGLSEFTYDLLSINNTLHVLTHPLLKIALLFSQRL